MRWSLNDSDFRSTLSSDLEWMIQSGQVSTEGILTALIQQYYLPAHQVVFAVLEDETAARRTLREVFQRAATEAYRHRSQAGIDGWFYGVVWRKLLQIQRQELRWRKVEGWLHAPGEFTRFRPSARSNQFDEIFLASVDRLPPTQRTMMFFVEVGGLSAEIMGQITGQPAASIEDDLELIWHALNEDHTGTGLSGALFRSRGQAAFQVRRPNIEVSPEQLDEVARSVTQRLAGNKGQPRGSATFKEIAFLVVAALLVVAVIWGGQQLLSRSGSEAAPGANVPRETGWYPETRKAKPGLLAQGGQLHNNEPIQILDPRQASQDLTNRVLVFMREFAI